MSTIRNNFVKFKYMVEEIAIMLDKENLKIPSSRFLSLHIDHNFMTSIVPIINMDMILESVEVRKVKESKNTRIKVSIMETEVFESGIVKSKRMWLNKVFDAQFVSDDITKDTSHKELKEEYGQKMQGASFVLYDKHDLNILNTEMNFIFANISPTDVLNSCLLERGTKKIVIASPPDISTRLPKCQIPIGKLVNNIDFLTNNYGLYKSIPIVYKDIDYLYIINRLTIPIDIKNEKNTVAIRLRDLDKEGPIGFPVNITSKDYYELEYPKDKLSRETVSENFEALVRPNNFITIDSKGNTNTISNNKEITSARVIRAQHGISGKLAGDKIDKNNSHLLNFIGVSISYFRPYRRFLFLNNNEYKGDYFLFRVSIELDARQMKDPSLINIEPKIAAYITRVK